MAPRYLNFMTHALMFVFSATKLEPADVDVVAERLAVSAIIVQDLKHTRKTRYDFNWKKMLQFEGNTGVFLQYTHARLCRY